jgi:hypothetical protein
MNISMNFFMCRKSNEGEKKVVKVVKTKTGKDSLTEAFSYPIILL